MADFDRYLPDGWEPHASQAKEMFYSAQAEMLQPVPSSKFLSFPMLNTMTGGLRPHEFTILCGATGTGKTTFCANLSADFIRKGIPQYVASVETGATDYIRRMISAIQGEDWNTGDAVPLDPLKLFNAKHGKLFHSEGFWMSLFDDRDQVERLMADISYCVKNKGIKIAIIDNLNFFMEVTSESNAVVEMDRVIHNLIIFCKQIPVHIIMVMHPKKTDHGRVDSEFDIKGSSTAVQEAHNVFLWNRAHEDLIKNGKAFEGDRELFLAKMRRRGKYVRRRLIIKSENGVKYSEGEIV